MPTNSASTLVILYCISTAVAIAVRSLRIPYTITLVVVGLALGSFRVVTPPHLTQELLFTFFLPGLLFEAAFHLDLTAFRQVWRSAVGLALPGVLAATGITALLVVTGGRVFGVATPIDMSFGLVFGALVAATDPVAVTALFRELRAPRRLAALVEAESLFNDGTGVVFLSLVLAYVMGGDMSLATASVQFALVAGGGVLVGLCVGWVVSIIIHRVDAPVIEIGLTVIAAYGSFVLADRLAASGVLATVVSGMMCGRQGRDRGMSAPSREAVQSFWEYIAFALNSIVFLLIGFQFDAIRLRAIWPEILLAFAAMLLARAVIVASMLLLQRASTERMPRAWGGLITLGGLRGALSVVLALALPPELAQRDVIVSLTVGVVLVSIIGQGLSMPLLLRRLGMRGALPLATDSHSAPID